MEHIGMQINVFIMQQINWYMEQHNIFGNEIKINKLNAINAV